ncbi:MAG: Thiol-disulfide oxidoreductase ResA [candidate division BRC1 bacterium ADurb.BinA364]|nr:MAG: Thiol-disulfide oxidoreductase ResA [candidate division BRC1 bacterium ADurb.BinA364]
MDSKAFFLAVGVWLLACASALGAGDGEAAEIDWPAAGEARVIQEAEIQRIVESHGKRLLVVNFWATWCGPCVEEMPYFAEAYREFQDQGALIVGFSTDFVDEWETAVPPFLKDKRIPYPNFVVDVDPNIMIPRFSPDWSGALPATFYYGPKGEKLGERLGKVDQETLRNDILAHLGGGGAEAAERDSSSGAIPITVRANSPLRVLAGNPVGLCMSFPSDRDNDLRERSMADAVREMRCGSLRFPMGTLAENYLWHAPGEYESAAQGLRPRVASMKMPPGDWTWAVEPDGSFKDICLDFDEFIALCRETNTEPVVMAAAHPWKFEDSRVSREQTIESAAEWVRYSNLVRGYGVRYWEIGNENDLKKIRETISKEEYLALARDMSIAMKAVDPSIEIGLGVFGTNNGEYYRDAFAFCPDQIDFLVAHQYLSGVHNFEEYGSSEATFIGVIENAIRQIEASAPANRASEIEVLVTEFGSYSPGGAWKTPDGAIDRANDIFKSLCTFEMLANAVCLDSRVRFLHFWITHSPWGDPANARDYANALSPENRLLPQGRALQVFAQFLLDGMVQAPRVAGPLRVYASASTDGKRLSVWMLNKSGAEQSAALALEGFDGAASGQIWTYAGDGPYDTNPAWGQTGAVDWSGGPIDLALPPASITVVSLAK